MKILQCDYSLVYTNANESGFRRIFLFGTRFPYLLSIVTLPLPCRCGGVWCLVWFLGMGVLAPIWKCPEPVAHLHSTQWAAPKSFGPKYGCHWTGSLPASHLILSQFVQNLKLLLFKYFDHKAQTIYHKVDCHQVE